MQKLYENKLLTSYMSKAGVKKQSLKFPAGTIIEMPSGDRYEVQGDGSWRKIKT